MWLFGKKKREVKDNSVIVIVGASQGLGSSLAECLFTNDAISNYDLDGSGQNSGCRINLVLSSRNLDKLKKVKMDCIVRRFRPKNYQSGSASSLDPESADKALLDEEDKGLKHAMKFLEMKMNNEVYEGECVFADDILEMNKRILTVQADVCKEEDCKRLIDETIRAYGRIDYVILNSGVNSDVSVVDSNTAVFHTIMNTNVIGLAAVIQFALPYLHESQGLVVALSSLAGVLPVPGGSHYSASKHALEGYLESIRPELKAYGIDLCIVDPGSMKSDDGAKRQVVMANGQVEDAKDTGTYRGAGKNKSRVSNKISAERIMKEGIMQRKERIYSQWFIVFILLVIAQYLFPAAYQRYSTRNRYPNGIPVRRLVPNASIEQTSASISSSQGNKKD